MVGVDVPRPMIDFARSRPTDTSDATRLRIGTRETPSSRAVGAVQAGSARIAGPAFRKPDDDDNDVGADRKAAGCWHYRYTSRRWATSMTSTVTRWSSSEQMIR